MKVIFFGKQGHYETEQARLFLQDNCDLESYMGKWGEGGLPESAFWWKGDLCISYNSRWIIPESIIKFASIAAINFHPGPPTYPGIGCVNWALYEGVESFGATCHYMTPEVDTGEIVSLAQFEIRPSDTVDSLLRRTYAYQLTQFYDVVGDILHFGEVMHTSNLEWSGKRRSRKDLNDLSRITPDMPEEEVKRRVRATSYQGWKPYTEIGGMKFEYTSR